MVSYQELLQHAKVLQDQLRSWRRQIHRYPELGFTETRTAGLVQATLFDLGVETETEVANHRHHSRREQEEYYCRAGDYDRHHP